MTIHQKIQAGARQAAGFIAVLTGIAFFCLLSGLAGRLTGV